MINFDYIWGLDQVLVDFGVDELWHLMIVHALIVSVFFIINVIILKPLLRILNKRLLVVSTFLSTVIFGWTITWLIVFGILNLLLGIELSLARYLYIYCVVLFICLALQIHIEIVVPDYDTTVEDEPESGSIKTRNKEVHQQPQS